jgi:hypothetical protein
VIHEGLNQYFDTFVARGEGIACKRGTVDVAKPSWVLTYSSVTKVNAGAGT